MNKKKQIEKYVDDDNKIFKSTNMSSQYNRIIHETYGDTSRRHICVSDVTNVTAKFESLRLPSVL